MSQDDKPMAVTHHYTHSDRVAATVSATAALFNVLVITVVSLVVMPAISNLTVETQKNRQVVESNRDMMLESNKEMESHRATVRRLNDLIDKAVKDAEERARKAKEKDRKDK